MRVLFRSEVVATRKGVSVEIDNTDAEGRVILADALARAGELEPALLLDFATLTGAARIALGPDVPALYSNDDAVADAWLAAAARVRDPMWRMPPWRPYLRYLTSTVPETAHGSSNTLDGSADRKSVVSGNRGSGLCGLGGRGSLQTQKPNTTKQ